MYVVEEGKETPDFWEQLGGKGAVASAAAGGDDAAFEKCAEESIVLLKVPTPFVPMFLPHSSLLF